MSIRAKQRRNKRIKDVATVLVVVVVMVSLFTIIKQQNDLLVDLAELKVQVQDNSWVIIAE